MLVNELQSYYVNEIRRSNTGCHNCIAIPSVEQKQTSCVNTNTDVAIIARVKRNVWHNVQKPHACDKEVVVALFDHTT